ncbi:MAG TPA: class I SAM-dependent methyltransferase [Candidatus Atribacteria bacterium]|nr:class I SAM-dependent methyltransferase [Candidatus Atribacteria bacterium]
MFMVIYKNPLYYEIAFSFVNAEKQVDLFEKFIKKFSKIKVKRFLDIGCGPSLQLREIAKRGYEAVGLDSSSKMLKYLEQKGKEKGIKIETVKADMIDFHIKKKADFVFIMMGTIGYIKNNEDFLKHLNSVAHSLRKGGLYLIENFTLDWLNFKPQSWTMSKDGIKVKTTYRVELKDSLNQIITEKLKLEVNDRGKRLLLERKCDRKLIFPQEFLTLLKLNNRFEFLGWFTGFSKSRYPKRLSKSSMDNIVLLRRN